MNRLLTLLLAASCLTAVGQVTYPYNPDGNADGDIAVGDLQDFLVTYGNHFWQNALVNTLIGISYTNLNTDFFINSLGSATTVRCLKD